MDSRAIVGRNGHRHLHASEPSRCSHGVVGDVWQSSDVGERQDLPSIVLQQIEHFFTHYKDLEAEKWVRVGHWGNAEDARRIVVEAIDRERDQKAKAQA